MYLLIASFMYTPLHASSKNSSLPILTYVPNVNSFPAKHNIVMTAWFTCLDVLGSAEYKVTLRGWGEGGGVKSIFVSQAIEHFSMTFLAQNNSTKLTTSLL